MNKDNEKRKQLKDDLKALKVELQREVEYNHQSNLVTYTPYAGTNNGMPQDFFSTKRISERESKRKKIKELELELKKTQRKKICRIM